MDVDDAAADLVAMNIRNLHTARKKMTVVLYFIFFKKSG